MNRYSKRYILAHPEDCIAPHGLDLTEGGRDAIKVDHLYSCFTKDGFDPNEPALVGYPLNDKIQLLTGTHRHEAAKRANMMLPITIHLRSAVEAAWGTPAWDILIQDIPVKDLENVIIERSEIAGLNERVDLSKDMEYIK